MGTPKLLFKVCRPLLKSPLFCQTRFRVLRVIRVIRDSDKLISNRRRLPLLTHNVAQTVSLCHDTSMDISIDKMAIGLI